jgi:hypothetical protein
MAGARTEPTGMSASNERCEVTSMKPLKTDGRLAEYVWDTYILSPGGEAVPLCWKYNKKEVRR